MNKDSRSVGLTRAARLLVGALVGCSVELGLGLAAPSAWEGVQAIRQRPGSDAAAALADVATLLGLAAWTWLFLAVGVAVSAGLCGPSSAPLQATAVRLAPAVARSLVAWLLGASTLGITVAAAASAPAATPGPVAAAGLRWGMVHSVAPTAALRGLRLPDRATGRGTASQSAARQRGTVVVRPGDTLWAITAATLHPHATTAEIAASWPAWYAANRTRIGSDPDLLLPGTVLRRPAPDHPSPERLRLR